MRTDRPWLEIGRAIMSRPPKPERLIEQEVAPGRILFRQWLAILGAVFGLAGAGATLGSTAHRGANGAAVSRTSGDDCLLNLSWCGGPSSVPELPGPDLHAILPSGRRRDPDW